VADVSDAGGAFGRSCIIIIDVVFVAALVVVLRVVVVAIRAAVLATEALAPRRRIADGDDGANARHRSTARD
jgi:hypothetical protein